MTTRYAKPLWSLFFESPVAVGVSQMLARASELRLPEPMLKLFIAAYTAGYGVDMRGVLTPPDGFQCFGDFFARRLRPEARPVCCDSGAVASPCDATVLEFGLIDDAAADLIVIKSIRYSIRDFIGDADIAASLAGGGYCVLYLHPRDYHRVHVPVNGTLRAIRHMPGSRYPVAPWASRLFTDAIGKNERMAFDIELSEDGHRCVLLMVAAFGVGGIDSSYLPQSTDGRRRDLNNVVSLGDELGTFRIGSTVVLLWPKGAVEIDSRLNVNERVLVGQHIGRLCGSQPHA